MADDDFTKQLQDACRAEGLEHVQLLVSALVKLEHCLPSEAPPLVEQSFRSLHNLKGSAHAAEFYTIESLCHPMEDIVSAVKSGKLEASSRLIDLLLEGVTLVEQLFRDENDAAHTAEVAAIVVQLKAILGTPEPEATADKDAASEPLHEEIFVQSARRPAQIAVDPAATLAAVMKADDKEIQETLRVPALKLDSLLQQAEEMLSLKAIVRQNAGKAEDLRLSLELQARAWSKAAVEIAQAREMIGTMLTTAESVQQKAPWHAMNSALDLLDNTLTQTQTRVRELCKDLVDATQTTSTSVDDLLDDTKSLLMNPCSSLFSTLPLLVRKLSRQLGKQVEISISGGEIELDRRILGQLKDPLIHLLRNSLDHGMETPEERTAKGKPGKGSIRLSASHVDRMVEIRLEDDGRGIDSSKVKDTAVKQGIITSEEASRLPAHEALRLIFKSALSTSSTITEISGRGLGLAIVEEKIEQLGGSIGVETTFGQGTAFVLRLPLTIATFRGVIVQVAGKSFAVPTSNIERVVCIGEDVIKSVDETDTFLLEGTLLPLGSMQDVLRLPATFNPRNDEQLLTVAIVRSGSERIGFIVDEVVAEQDMLVKNLGPVFEGVTSVLGVTVLGSGHVVPILNVLETVRTFRDRHGRSIVQTKLPTGDAESAAEEPAKRRSKTANVLVVDDMVTARMLMRNILESAGFGVKTANNGLEAFNILEQEQFDIVVTDIEMPVLDGIGLTEKIRAHEKLKSLPVVIVTSMASREDRERGVKAGANAYFAKNSFDESNLLDVVGKLI